MFRAHILASLLPVVASLLHAQARPVPTRQLKAVGSFSGDFSEVTGVAELRDGRVVVSDIRERAVRVVDFSSGRARQIGRTGEGPNEYKNPGGLYAGLGDTLYLQDRGQPRLLLISQGGTIVGMRSTERRGVRESSDGGQDPKRIDRSGRVVGEGARFSRRSATSTSEAPDSSYLLRFDPSTQKEDTLARLRLPPTQVQRNGQMVMARSALYGPQDVWALAPNGRLAIVRAEPYRVEYLENGTRTVGPEVAVARVPVTDDDKKLYARGGAPVLLGLGRGKDAGGTPKMEQINAPTDLLFADYKPAVAAEYAPLFAPDGRLWIWRHQRFGAAATVYDIADAKGVIVERVELPARSRVMGFGRGVVYAVTLDEDDVPVLKRFSLQ